MAALSDFLVRVLDVVKWTDSTDCFNSFLEYLLNNGATLLKEEEQGFLNLKPTHWAYKVVKLLKDKENGACQGDM